MRLDRTLTQQCPPIHSNRDNIGFNLEHVAGLEQKTKNQNQKEWDLKLSVLLPYQVLLSRKSLFLGKKEKEKSPLSFAFALTH